MKVFDFIDAVHPTQATKITSGWIRTGTDKPIKTTGSRTRVNIVGAIQLGQLAKAVTLQYDTVNAMNFLESLRWKSTTMRRNVMSVIGIITTLKILKLYGMIY